MSNFDTRKRDVKTDPSTGALLTTISNNTMYSEVVFTSGATSVGHSTETTILTYTATDKTFITQISASGEAPAKYKVFINTELKDTIMTNKYNVLFSFLYPLKLEVGDVLDVKVIHEFNGEVLNFNSTLYGYKP